MFKNKKRQVRVFGESLAKMGAIMAVNGMKTEVEYFKAFQFVKRGAVHDVFTVTFKADEQNYYKVIRQMNKYGVAML